MIPNHQPDNIAVNIQITLLRVIPTMTFIHFLTGKSSEILSGISSGILSGISSGICSGISSGILSGKSSGILSGISSGILSDISSGILSGISSGILSDISSGILSDIPSGISSGILSGRWGPAVPTAIWKSRLRSGSAHCDLELAVEVRQCPLRPGSRGWGPAVPTAICNSRLRSGSAHWDLELAVEVPAVPTGIWTARRRRRVRRRRRQRRRRRWRRRRALLKSSNPHLAGGEKDLDNIWQYHIWRYKSALNPPLFAHCLSLSLSPWLSRHRPPLPPPALPVLPVLPPRLRPGTATWPCQKSSKGRSGNALPEKQGVGMLFRNVGKELGNNPGDVGKLQPCVFPLFLVVITCHQKAVHLQLHGAQVEGSHRFTRIQYEFNMIQLKPCSHKNVDLPTYLSLKILPNVQLSSFEFPNPPTRPRSAGPPRSKCPAYHRWSLHRFWSSLWGNAPRHRMIFGDEKW